MPNTVLLIKDQRACWRFEGVNHCSAIPLKDQKATYVGGVESGVCGSYTTLHTEYCYSCWKCQRLLYCVYSGLLPLPGGKAICLSLPSWWFSCSPLVSSRRQLC